MTSLIVLLAVSAVLLTYPWWPDISLAVRWRWHLLRKRRSDARQGAEYKRRWPLL